MVAMARDEIVMRPTGLLSTVIRTSPGSPTGGESIASVRRSFRCRLGASGKHAEPDLAPNPLRDAPFGVRSATKRDGQLQMPGLASPLRSLHPFGCPQGTDRQGRARPGCKSPPSTGRQGRQGHILKSVISRRLEAECGMMPCSANRSADEKGIWVDGEVRALRQDDDLRA